MINSGSFKSLSVNIVALTTDLAAGRDEEAKRALEAKNEIVGIKQTKLL